MEVLEQPRRCQACDRADTPSKGSAIDHRDVTKCGSNEGHSKYADILILAMTILPRTKGADST
eukprot:962584-Prorocentrum_lima.AAC.1